MDHTLVMTLCKALLIKVVEVGQKQRYFKFVNSVNHCQQLGLYSKCYTVCDFTGWGLVPSFKVS